MKVKGLMGRFVLPAVVMVSALLVLLAGSIGNLRSWPDLPGRLTMAITGVPTVPAGSPPQRAAGQPENRVQPAAPAGLEQDIAGLQRQAAALQTQIIQRTHELEKMHADKAGLSQG